MICPKCGRSMRGSWEALHGLLIESGLRGVPKQLNFEREPVPDRIGPEVFFTQTCGYPLETIFAGQAVRLGTPCYAAPGCDGPTQGCPKKPPKIVTAASRFQKPTVSP